MKMGEVRAHAKSLGITSIRKSKEQVIREIQLAENNRDCFNRGESTTCGQDLCAWRADCK